MTLARVVTGEYLTAAERIHQIRDLRPFMDGPHMAGLGLQPWNPYGFWRDHGILAIPGIEDLPQRVRDDHEWARRWLAREDWKERCKRKRLVRARFRRIAIERAMGSCWYCWRPLADSQFVIDHVLPVSRGGRGNLRNLVACCEDCNASKADYLLHEWMDIRWTAIREIAEAEMQQRA